MHLVHVHIFTMASAEAYNLGITYAVDGMESLWREVLPELHFYLIPKLYIEVEGPKILQVRVGFASDGHHVLLDETACVVSSRARHRRGAQWFNLFNVN